MSSESRAGSVSVMETDVMCGRLAEGRKEQSDRTDMPVCAFITATLMQAPVCVCVCVCVCVWWGAGGVIKVYLLFSGLITMEQVVCFLLPSSEIPPSPYFLFLLAFFF